jgi:hypothetical protein
MTAAGQGTKKKKSICWKMFLNSKTTWKHYFSIFTIVTSTNQNAGKLIGKPEDSQHVLTDFIADFEK